MKEMENQIKELNASYRMCVKEAMVTPFEEVYHHCWGAASAISVILKEVFGEDGCRKHFHENYQLHFYDRHTIKVLEEKA